MKFIKCLGVTALVLTMNFQVVFTSIRAPGEPDGSGVFSCFGSESVYSFPSEEDEPFDLQQRLGGLRGTLKGLVDKINGLNDIKGLKDKLKSLKSRILKVGSVK